MPKPTLDYYDHNFIPFNTADFLVMFADHPNLGPMVSDFTIPSRSLGRVRAELMGKSRVFPGRRISASNEIQMTILLNRKDQTYQELLAIQDSFSEEKSGNMVGRPFVVKCIMYDDVGLEAMVFTFQECWLAEIGDLQLSSSADSQLAQVQVTLCYSRMGYQFTGLGNEQVISTVMSRITDGPIDVQSSDNYGVFTALNVSKRLPGSDPYSVISSIRQQLSTFVGFSIDDLNNMSSVISSLRGTFDGVTSKAATLANAASAARNITARLSSLAGIKSYF